MGIQQSLSNDLMLEIVYIGNHSVHLPIDATQLNGLEWDGESIWANRFQTDEIVRIRPDCWTVTRVAVYAA